MGEYFNENKKFLSLNGVIGRRDFIINWIIIELIESLLWVTPLVYITIFHPEISPLISQNDKPPGFLILTCILGLFLSCLYFPSILRRARDIIGEEDNSRIYLISSILTVLIFMSYTPVAGFVFAKWLIIFTVISLMVMRGKITGEKPQSEIIKFNWGAFFGTWLWGIFNKKYITLLILPLFLTAGWLPFMLICGLKGNEWAYETNKNKYENAQDFHSKQITQTILFTILAPIITLILLITSAFGAGVVIHNYVKSHPEYKARIIKSFEDYQTRATESTFSKIEFTQDEYKFYISPKDWSQISDVMKVSVIKNAQDYVIIKQGKYSFEQKDIFKSIDILQKVKIYSSFNNEILGSFDLTKEELSALKKSLDGNRLSEYRQILLSGYKLNKTPTLP